MKVYTAAQMREREQAAVNKGTSFDQLMENAGSSAARDLMQRHPQAGRALIVCGKGNNGGDSLVMARYMQAQGWHIDILFSLEENLSPLAQTNRERLNGLPHIELISVQELEGRLKTVTTSLSKAYSVQASAARFLQKSPPSAANSIMQTA